jgi:hypothetical protein
MLDVSLDVRETVLGPENEYMSTANDPRMCQLTNLFVVIGTARGGRGSCS